MTDPPCSALLEFSTLTTQTQTNMQKLAKVSEAFDGVRQEERKRKYRAQGKEEERLKKARAGGGGRGGRGGGRNRGGRGDDD